MKNIKFSRLFAAMMFVACLVFAGCAQPEDKTKEKEITLYGTWADDYEAYNAYGKYDCKITIEYIETSSYGKQMSPVYITKTSEDAGYIYYKFSENITGYDSNYNPMTVNSKGKWGAIAFKNLKADSVNMADVYDPTYDFPSTLEACIAKYTVAGGYFANMPEFKKL